MNNVIVNNSIVKKEEINDRVRLVSSTMLYESGVGVSNSKEVADYPLNKLNSRCYRLSKSKVIWQE